MIILFPFFRNIFIMKWFFLKQDFARRSIVSENPARAFFCGVWKKSNHKTLKNVWD